MTRRKRNPLQPTTNPIDPRCIVPGGRHRAAQGSRARPLPPRPDGLPDDPIGALTAITRCERTTERVRAWARAALSSTDVRVNPTALAMALGHDRMRYVYGVPAALVRCGLPGWRPSQLCDALAIVRLAAAAAKARDCKRRARRRR